MCTPHLLSCTEISIHASAREATKDRAGPTEGSRDFNPRFREGSDAGKGDEPGVQNISIHASAREATLSGSTVSV